MRISDLYSGLQEAKKSKGTTPQRSVVDTPAPMPVAVEQCPLFISSYVDKVRINKVLLNKVIEFVQKKAADPLMPVGNDRPLTSKGVFSLAIPGIRHAHLNLDISIWYVYVGGTSPTLRLYGLFTHAETGTGQPAKIQKQQSMATKMSNQKDFKPFPLPVDK
jgi:mRNA-degrading endonuclease YafQ of YafQ-DinJ toxin-antitoxin module